jgi:hypothetical protein
MVISLSTRSVRHSYGRRLCVYLLFLATGIASLPGCSDIDSARVPVHPVLGVIQFRGQPINGAFVTFHPQGTASVGVPKPRASVMADGAFTLTTYDGNDGAPSGDYVLTVQWYRPVKLGGDWVGGPNILPKKYASPSTSNVRVTVVAGENRLNPIQLR